MRLMALEIPDDAAALAGWLEGHLVGLDLAALVAELEAVHSHDQKQPAPPLDQVLGNLRAAVQSRGLETLLPDRLPVLLQHPRLLLELQESLLVEGGPYWRRMAPRNAGREQRVAVERGWERLTASLSEDRVPATVIPLPRDATARAPAGPAPGTRPWRRLLGGLATMTASAAMLVAAFVIAMHGPGGENGAGASAGWGWNKPGGLRYELSRDAYLNSLADSAREWFNQRPDRPQALARRIAEFRQGCSVLIFSVHKPLPEEDRVWLVEKCRTWAAKLDAHLAAVESGQDVLKVRAEADETIERLATALRERAAKPA
jgi:hypothetical protein